jgi:mono/diheme cytochrome c family protein
MRCVSRWSWIVLLPIFLGMVALPGIRGKEKPAPTDDRAKGLALYKKHVAPLLEKHCFRCHSRSARTVHGEPDVLLDNRKAMLAERKGRPVVVPFKPEQSQIVKVLRHEVKKKERRMPPPEQIGEEPRKLPEEDIKAVETWIRLGAPTD